MYMYIYIWYNMYIVYIGDYTTREAHASDPLSTDCVVRSLHVGGSGRQDRGP